MKMLWLISVGLLGAITAWAQTMPVAKPVTISAMATAPDSLPVKIVELRGDGTALGKAYGTALGPVIHELDDKYLGSFLANPAARYLAGLAAMSFESTLRPEHLEEIRAMAATIHIDEGEAMLANSFLDLIPMVACSTITLPAEAMPDHVARFARNLDFASLGVADKDSAVLIYHPKDRYSFAAIGWPGMIGVLSGMNEFGLTLCCMEVARNPGLPRAMPYAILYRCVLEHCKTVDEAIAFLQNTPRQTPNNLMLMDAAGHRAVVELTPEKVVVRSGQAGAALISTNHQRGQEADKPGLCDRYDYLHNIAQEHFGKITVPQLISMLEHVQQPDLTMQSMIFEPANRVLYLAVGSNAPERKFVKLELKNYFK